MLDALPERSSYLIGREGTTLQLTPELARSVAGIEAGASFADLAAAPLDDGLDAQRYAVTLRLVLTLGLAVPRASIPVPA